MQQKGIKKNTDLRQSVQHSFDPTELGGGEGSNRGEEVTFLLFRKETALIKDVGTKVTDPKQMMDTLLKVKDGIVTQFTSYKRADKNADFHQKLLTEVGKLTIE